MAGQCYLQSWQYDTLSRVRVRVYDVQCSRWFEFGQVDKFPVCNFIINFLGYGREAIVDPNLILPCTWLLFREKQTELGRGRIRRC